MYNKKRFFFLLFLYLQSCAIAAVIVPACVYSFFAELLSIPVKNKNFFSFISFSLCLRFCLVTYMCIIIPEKKVCLLCIYFFRSKPYFFCFVMLLLLLLWLVQESHSLVKLTSLREFSFSKDVHTIHVRGSLQRVILCCCSCTFTICTLLKESSLFSVTFSNELLPDVYFCPHTWR